MAVGADSTCQDRLAEESREHLSSAALRAYGDQITSDQRDLENERIVENLPMVRRIVAQVVSYLHPPLSFEDMVSAGAVGLVRAARDYDPAHQTEFQTYAYIRIKGAILDELRDWSFIPANLNKRIRDARRLSQKILVETGIAPSDTELAERLGVTLDELYETFENARARHFASLDGFADDSPALGQFLATGCAVTPDAEMERAELIEKLAGAIQGLNGRQRQVILLYYQQQLTMRQIADILELTESRVSQLHASALFVLSVRLGQWKDVRL
ncbi:MAG: FliA/WhiG family RNA polymerase sigma factor [Sedimentisphaerales bacterium]